MKKLLSLPPNVVESCYDIARLSKDEFFCTCDPPGHKLGSGGGTAWIVEKYEEKHSADPTDKKIIIHGGGQSRRLPAYAPSGKLLTPVPVCRWERGGRIDQTLLDLQLPLYENIMRRAPQSLTYLIASGDVLLRATEPLQDIPEADVVCYGLRATPLQMSHHGVFLMRNDAPTTLDFMLQKPSESELAALEHSHSAMIDIGVWLLSQKAMDLLSQKSKTPDGRLHFYDLYGEFGCALGQTPSSPDSDLSGLKVAILPLRGGEFYHFGTGAEMLKSALELQSLKEPICRKDEKHKSVLVQNSIIPSQLTENREFIWIENSYLNDDWELSRRNIITGVPRNTWKVKLNEGICIDIVPVGEREYALRPYGMNDAFRGSLSDAGTLFLEKSFCTWAKRHGVSADEGLSADDIQAAPLFPVSESVEQLGKWLEWFLCDEPDMSLAKSYLQMPRMSADELSEKANLRRLFEQRRELQATCLGKLAEHWEYSIFYQSDLRDISSKYKEYNIPLPHALPSSAPLLSRMSDAMLHGDDASAFNLLREGLTAKVLKERVLPHKTTCDDQMAWGRSAVRIDLAGGWTDTPPYCLQAGGNVVNMAINLNGQQPIQAFVKPCKEPVILCHSIDLGATERIETYEKLRRYAEVGSPFSIPKAALALCGFLPEYCSESYPSLRSQLEHFGCGIEVTMLSAVPAGSGLGTSSILAATVLGTLSDFCGMGWDKHEIAHRTLVLEQLLTTGGGWQDQYGGILPGIKLLLTDKGFDQTVRAESLPATFFTSAEEKSCHLLYYTGITRTAKHILAEIVRGMFLNSASHLRLLSEMKDHAMELAQAIGQGNFSSYGSLVRCTWEQNKRLDSGTNPPAVEQLCQLIDDYCLGYKLPGTGGGGFMYMVAKDPQAAQRIRQILNETPLTPNSRFVEMQLSESGLEVSRS